MQKTFSRRALFALPLVVAGLAGCKKDPTATPSASAPSGRCSNCGMKLDPASAWLAEIVQDDGTKLTFDTPRCALTASLAGKKGKLRFQDYYDKKWHDAGELRLVTGSNVLGPMGPDLVPVDPARAQKFSQDHEGDKTLTVAEITKAVLDDLK